MFVRLPLIKAPAKWEMTENKRLLPASGYGMKGEGKRANEASWIKETIDRY
jgi:hypothetical protein